jgi:hypothetical protein
MSYKSNPLASLLSRPQGYVVGQERNTCGVGGQRRDGEQQVVVLRGSESTHDQLVIVDGCRHPLTAVVIRNDLMPDGRRTECGR